MITQTQLRAYLDAQKAVQTLERQLKQLREVESKLGAELLTQLSQGERCQRGRLGAAIEEHTRRNIPYKTLAIALSSQEAVEAMADTIAPTVSQHVVIVPSHR